MDNNVLTTGCSPKIDIPASRTANVSEFPRADANYKELKKWNRETREKIKIFHNSSAAAAPTDINKHNNEKKENCSWVSSIIAFFICSSTNSRTTPGPTLSSIQNKRIQITNEHSAQENECIDAKAQFCLQLPGLDLYPLTSQVAKHQHHSNNPLPSFRRKFRRLAREHTNTINTIRALKQVILQKIAISPCSQVAEMMKLDAVTAEQERLRLETTREQHVLELLQLEEKQQAEELQLSNEIEQEDMEIARETNLIKEREKEKQRRLNKLSGADSPLVEPELEIQHEFTAHNNLKSEMIRIHQDRRIQLKFRRMEHRKQQQELHRKQLEEMLRRHKQQIDLNTIQETKEESDLETSSAANTQTNQTKNCNNDSECLIDRSSFFRMENSTSVSNCGEYSISESSFNNSSCNEYGETAVNDGYTAAALACLSDAKAFVKQHSEDSLTNIPSINTLNSTTSLPEKEENFNRKKNASKGSSLQSSHFASKTPFPEKKSYHPIIVRSSENFLHELNNTIPVSTVEPQVYRINVKNNSGTATEANVDNTSTKCFSSVPHSNSPVRSKSVEASSRQLKSAMPAPLKTLNNFTLPEPEEVYRAKTCTL